LAKIVQDSPILSSSLAKLITLQSLGAQYDAVFKFVKQTDGEKEFLEKFGTKKQFMGQFKRQSYDGRA
jgi:hypothetical protein